MGGSRGEGAARLVARLRGEMVEVSLDRGHALIEVRDGNLDVAEAQLDTEDPLLELNGFADIIGGRSWRAED